MVRKKFMKMKNVTIALQKFNLEKNYGNIIINEKKLRNHIDIDMLIQPTEFSDKYTIKLIYSLKKPIPKVYLMCSELLYKDEEKIPHIYGKEVINGKEYLRLCLYYREEWNKNMNISDTIIPWACEWIYFYEIWCITGIWKGGGIHPINIEK